MYCNSSNTDVQHAMVSTVQLQSAEDLFQTTKNHQQ